MFRFVSVLRVSCPTGAVRVPYGIYINELADQQGVSADA
jgi:hypothetical protein